MTREYQIAAQVQIAAQAEELRPCPFCGVRPERIREFTEFGVTKFSIDCQNTECQINVRTIYIANIDEVIKRWNTRAAPPEGMVMVPKSALDWLFGNGPDADGEWFSETYDALKMLERLSFWWRPEFRKRLAAAEAQQEDK